MRGKRAKAYRKLMHKYELHFKFRQPYQILVDAEFLQEADRCKMDLSAYLSRTVQGEIKPMITQCSIRHLYASSSKTNPNLVEQAKSLERRRCNHHLLDEPLSTFDCLTSVIHPKKPVGTPPSELRNKHRYIVATQDSQLRTHLRAIPGVPVVYLNRSVMILESMSRVSALESDAQERAKFTAGILERIEQPSLGKRPREDGDSDDGGDEEKEETGGAETKAGAAPSAQPAEPAAKKARKGPKQPNPLSVRKKKAGPAAENQPKEQRPTPAPTTEGAAKRRRKRKTAPSDSNRDGGAFFA